MLSFDGENGKERREARKENYIFFLFKIQQEKVREQERK